MPIMVMPRIMLLHIFAACPAPLSPQCTTWPPIMSNNGAARVNAAPLPPAIKVSVPAVAPPIPPETGASTANNAAAVASIATLRAVSTSTVEQSTNPVFFAITGMISAATLRRIVPFGNIVMTASCPAAASTAVPAMVMPATVTFAVS